MHWWLLLAPLKVHFRLCSINEVEEALMRITIDECSRYQVARISIWTLEEATRPNQPEAADASIFLSIHQ